MKLKLRKLIEKYEATQEMRTKNMTEEEVKKDFILPFFEILGWDVYNKKHHNEVSAEEKTLAGHADYTFRINNIPKFFVEAKSIRAGVEDDKSAFQAINYAYTKATTWAILTNFETIRVFNAEIQTKLSQQAQFFQVGYGEFLDRFDQIYLLSRQSVMDGDLDRKAERWGKKRRKTRIDKQLLNDLKECRKQLQKSILATNKSQKLEDGESGEAAQRILDRLIFIRTIEDRQIRPNELKSIGLEGKGAWDKLKNIFKEYDTTFNSNLFAKHLCDSLHVNDQTIVRIILGLYETSDKTVIYDFASIDSDVLGIMYEQYLGQMSHMAKNPKRKAQGIYYTPKHVVDYIVKNTVGVYIDGNRHKLKRPRIPVVDPACGSGSFLLGAMDYMISLDSEIAQREKNIRALHAGSSDIATERMMYVKNAIFGVDLDQQAVDIARLNLVLRAAETQARLPILNKNIQQGNSLISKSQYSELNFDWSEKMNVGFKAVIGNPPYCNINKPECRIDPGYKKGLKDEYGMIYTGQNDILYFFYVLGLEILDDGGYLGFITSRYFLEANHAKGLREYLKKNSKIIEIIDFGNKIHIFEDASVNTCIVILKKTRARAQNHKITIVKVKSWGKNVETLFQYINDNKNKTIKNKQIQIYQKPQNDLSDHMWSLKTQEAASLFRTLTKNSTHLGDHGGSKGVCRIFKSVDSGCDTATVHKGNTTVTKDVFRVSAKTMRDKKLERGIIKPLVKNGMIRRYRLNYTGEGLIFTTGNEQIANYPNVLAHLKKFEKRLKDRHDYRRALNTSKEFSWWRLANLRNLHRLQSKNDKLFVPMIAPENRFIFIEKDSYYCTADVYVLVLQSKKFNLRYVQGVLNSQLMNLVVKNSSKAVDGSARTADGTSQPRYSYSVKNLEKIPIKNATEADQTKIADLATQLELEHKKLNSKKTGTERILKNIEKIDCKINDLVLGIYGLKQEDLDSLR